MTRLEQSVIDAAIWLQVSWPFETRREIALATHRLAVDALLAARESLKGCGDTGRVPDFCKSRWSVCTACNPVQPKEFGYDER
jgi:hypothetical protein